jgi:hypothetical protein
MLTYAARMHQLGVESIGDIKAYFDIPFIQHYRKEYYEPDLRAQDLWAIYDLDARYCDQADVC